MRIRFLRCCISNKHDVHLKSPSHIYLLNHSGQVPQLRCEMQCNLSVLFPPHGHLKLNLPFSVLAVPKPPILRSNKFTWMLRLEQRLQRKEDSVFGHCRSTYIAFNPSYDRPTVPLLRHTLPSVPTTISCSCACCKFVQEILSSLFDYLEGAYASQVDRKTPYGIPFS